MAFFLTVTSEGNFTLLQQDGSTLFVQALEGGGTEGLFLIEPTIAALSAVDVAGLGLVVGQPANVQSNGSQWALTNKGTLAVDGITVASSTDPTLVWQRNGSFIVEAARAQSTWNRNPQTGNDEADGLTAATSIKTRAEVMRRWGGTWSPDLAQDVTIINHAADTDLTDPSLFAPTMLNGSTFLETADLPAATFTGTLLAVAPKSFSPSPGVALSSTFSATSGAVVAQMMIVNATRGGSTAFVQRDLGEGIWQLGQPLMPYAGGLPTPVEVDTWADGDTVTGYLLLNQNIPVIGGSSSELDQDTFAPNRMTQLVNLWANGGFSPLALDAASNFLVERCSSERPPSVAGAPLPSVGQFFMNCAFSVQGNTYSEQITFSGGFALGGLFYGASFQNSFIMSGNATITNGDEDDSDWYLDTGVTVDLVGTTFFGGTGEGGGASKTYGPGTLNSDGLALYHETAEDHFLVKLTIGDSANAYSNLTTAGVVAVHQLALTAAALDAAAGAAGFGGLAYVPGVGGFQSDGAAP